jgi:hypothetical protein
LNKFPLTLALSPTEERGKRAVNRRALINLARQYDLAYRESAWFRREIRLKRAIAARRRRGQPFLTPAILETLARWKSPRILPLVRRNSPLAIRRAARLAAAAGDEASRLETLLVLRGVGIPLASVILHFTFPNRYPVLDANVLAALPRLGLRDRVSKSPAGWVRLCAAVRRLRSRYRLSLRTLDKALWILGRR